jgi:hypothetical protein
MVKSNQILETTEELLLFYKAYINKDKDDLGGLCPPTDMMADVSKLALQTYVNVTQRTLHQPRLMERILDEVTQAVNCVYPDWLSDGPCLPHRQFAFRHLILVKIRKECGWISKELRMPATKAPTKLPIDAQKPARSNKQSLVQKADRSNQKLSILRHT